MNTNEEKTKSKIDSVEFISDKLDTPIVKYFWQASPLSGSRKTSTHKFFRQIKAFENFSDHEVFLFSKFLHVRNFESNEMIFREGDGGFGFYFIFNGSVNIYTDEYETNSDELKAMNFVTQLEKCQYFGELALLEPHNRRNASAVSQGVTTLLAVYKPDLEELIERYPVVGAKFLQTIALIVASRLQRIAKQFRTLKDKQNIQLGQNANKEEV
jgi:CRP/FNR family cyclic AMP-dependent transcriptional regulator